MTKKAEYALYKGDKFIDLGTKEYLAKKLGVKKEWIEHMNTPSYKKRRIKDDNNSMLIIRIEDDINDGES